MDNSVLIFFTFYGVLNLSFHISMIIVSIIITNHVEPDPDPESDSDSDHENDSYHDTESESELKMKLRKRKTI